MLRRAFLLFALLLSLRPGFAAEIPAKDRIVVLVTIDGFPSWIWDDPALPMPFLRLFTRHDLRAVATLGWPVFVGQVAVML